MRRSSKEIMTTAVLLANKWDVSENLMCVLFVYAQCTCTSAGTGYHTKHNNKILIFVVGLLRCWMCYLHFRSFDYFLFQRDRKSTIFMLSKQMNRNYVQYISCESNNILNFRFRASIYHKIASRCYSTPKTKFRSRTWSRFTNWKWSIQSIVGQSMSNNLHMDWHLFTVSHKIPISCIINLFSRWNDSE